MQEPITVLTNLPILLFSLYAFLSLLIKNKSIPTLLYSLFFFFLFLMTLFGTLFHINNTYFSPIQQYGTMVVGGLLSTSLAFAALFDNFKTKPAMSLSIIPLLLLVIYFFTFNIGYFLPFLILQLANILLVIFSYSKNPKSQKSRLIYTASFLFIIAGLIQALGIKLYVLNHNDIFHLVSIIPIVLVYKASAPKSPKGDLRIATISFNTA